jgi:SAM-dependent methyltransferase
MRFLDVGCGSGLFCRLATDAGARVAGIDAAAPLIEIARRRVPDGDFRVGDLQLLPYEEGRFDLVTGFNSFQYADPAVAFAQACRVARRGGRVLALVWGRPERTELAALLEALLPLLPPPPRDAPGPFALSGEGALEGLATAAGLTPKSGGYLETSFEYPDQPTLVRASLSSGPAALAIRSSGEEAARRAVIAGLAPFRTARAGYRIETEWRYLLAVK